METLASPPPPAGVDGAAIPSANPAEDLTLRPGRPEDAEACGRICFEAFRGIATHHAFPPDFPAAADAAGLFRLMLSLPEVHVVVAEAGGRIVGSNALWEQTPIAGVGPITIEPELQNGAVGRALMRHVLDRAEHRGHRGVRLCQAAYHARSLALYTKLGFDAREPLTVLQGTAVGATLPGRRVRTADGADLEPCGRLHERLHGYSRAGELGPAISRGTARVVERDGRITGYATETSFFGHAIGEANEDVMALIAAAESFAGPGILVPTRNAALLRWCLEHGLRVVQPMTLMSRGFWVEPQGAYLPSVLF